MRSFSSKHAAATIACLLLLTPVGRSVDLYRNDSIASLDSRPDLSAIFTRAGWDCWLTEASVTLDPCDPLTCQCYVGESALLSGNGSSDNDDLYAWTDFATGPRPDDEPGGMVESTDRPLIFWQAGGLSSANAFRMVKAPGGMTVEMSDAAPPPIGACCDDVFGCWDGATAASCTGLTRVFLEGRVCADRPCMGKCCEASTPGLCRWATEGSCGGPWWGTDLLCGPFASCCLSASCVDGVDPECCRALGGGVRSDVCGVGPPC